MKLKRYYVNQDLSILNNVKLTDDEFHHMVNVMRAKQGDKIELFCGDKFNYIATIEKIEKKFAECKIEQCNANLCEPNLQLDVFQALAKGDKLSIIMQKITEIGASNLYVFNSRFCDVKPNTGKLDRLSLVSVSASKQCGRSSIVNTVGVIEIKDICKLINQYDKFFVFYEASDEFTFKEYILKLVNEKPKKVAIMVGAEGGFDSKEIELLKQSGAIIVGLGKRILRTETASIAGSSVVMQMLDV